jgi:hypothetical protein
MHTHRSRLLITLAFLCMLVLGASNGWAGTVSLRYAYSYDGASSSTLPPGWTPNAGEPDVGQGQGPMLLHNSMTQTRREGAAVSASKGRYMAVLRWARMFWMARYPGLTP